MAGNDDVRSWLEAAGTADIREDCRVSTREARCQWRRVLRCEMKLVRLPLATVTFTTTISMLTSCLFTFVCKTRAHGDCAMADCDRDIPGGGVQLDRQPPVPQPEASFGAWAVMITPRASPLMLNLSPRGRMTAISASAGALLPASTGTRSFTLRRSTPVSDTWDSCGLPTLVGG